jgi:Zn finger protein HypA/HybF involved in hydrogenase expression
VDFDINEFACIEPESIRFYYEFLTKDNTTLGGAKLSFKKISPAMICNNCMNVFKISNFKTRCPECNSPEIRFKETDDIKITAIHTENS